MVNNYAKISHFREKGMVFVRGIAKYLHKIHVQSFFPSVIKADRINALRKQYDDFLGEDRKRKERNEFILGRLDKMRTSIMQIRPTPNAYVSARSLNLYNRSMQILEKPGSGHTVQSYRTESQQPPLDNSVKKSEEAFLLQEISKKYILIPKNETFVNIYPRDTYEAHPIVKENVDNDDWKSKYEILAQLKQDEKEPIEMPAHGDKKYIDNIKEHPISDIKNKQLIEAEKLDDKVSESEDTIEIPEKELPDYNIAYNITNPEGMPMSRIEKREILISPPEDSNIVQFTLPEENFYSYSYSDDSKPQINKNLNDPKANTTDKKLELQQPEYDHSLPNEELANHQQSYNEKVSFEVEYEKQYQPSEEKYFENIVDPQENDMTPIEVVNAGDIVGHRNDKLGAQSQSEDAQYTEEIINPQDFTSNDNVKVWDGVNVNPEEYGINETHFDPAYHYDQQSAVYAKHVENPENASAINDASADDVNVNPEGYGINETHFDPAYHYDQQSAIYANHVENPENAPAINDASGNSVNVNPEGYGSNEGHFDPAYHYDPQSAMHVENPESTSAINDAVANEISSGIEAFNSEQSDLFYQEQVGDKAAYNQHDLVDPEYTQNENYDLQYSGYEATQEGAPAEVNEQEETSERYDPHYEQQYTPLNYEYEYPTQDKQEPSVVVHLDEQQEYNQNQMNHETSENVEQQLDKEEGFVETQNDRMEVENTIAQEVQPATQNS